MHETAYFRTPLGLLCLLVVIVARKPGPKVIKLFSMLNSAEHELYPGHKCLMPKIDGILTFRRFSAIVFK